jgi:hypothetical protein
MTGRARYFGCALLAAAAGLLALLVAHVPHGAPPADSGKPGEPRMERVRTEVYEANALRLTASARSVQFEPARVFGPFRIGFLRAVVASGVEIELQTTSTGGAALDLASYVKDTGRALARQLGSISGAELRELTVTRRDERGETLTLLRARRCRAELGARTMACSKGMLRDGDQLIAFGEAVHDGRQWQITRAVRR